MDNILKGLKIVILSLILFVPLALFFIYLKSKNKTLQTKPSWKIVELKDSSVDTENLESGLSLFKEVIEKLEGSK